MGRVSPIAKFSKAKLEQIVAEGTHGSNPTFGWPHAVIYINQQHARGPPWMSHVLAPSGGLNA